jgi:hypothetical protein
MEISTIGASHIRAACWATESNTGCTRIGDYAEDVGDRRLLLQRLVPFADDPRELGFMSASQ